MFTTAAFFESIDPGGTLQEIATVQDDHIFTQGDDLRVPEIMNNLIGEIALTAQINLIAAQLSSPSLRAIALKDMEPVLNAVVFGNPPEAIMHSLSPIPLTVDEALNMLISSDPIAKGDHFGFVWLADGAQNPVVGNIVNIRGTATIAQVNGVWTSGNISFTQDLPVGRYQVVGLRVRSADAVCARLIFRGVQWRPGVPVVNAIGDLDAPIFRMGKMGVWGEFAQVTPPSLEIIGGVAVSQTIIFDLIKVG